MSPIIKTYSYLAFIFLSALLFLSSCVAEIDLKLNSTYPRLVVDARLNMDTTSHCVILSRSSDYYASVVQVDYIRGADVFIQSPRGTFYLEEDSLQAGHYFTSPDVYGIQEESYILHIEKVDIDKDGNFESYMAEAQMPRIGDKIDSMKVVYGPGLPPFLNHHKNPGWNVLLYAQDPPEPKYYAFILKVNKKPINASILDLMILPDEFTRGQYIRGLPLYYFKKDSLAPGDIVDVEVRTLSFEYNQYISDLRNAVNGGMPIFGGAPANVRGNISNGGIGFFAVYANRSSSARVP